MDSFAVNIIHYYILTRSNCFLLYLRLTEKMCEWENDHNGISILDVKYMNSYLKALLERTSLDSTKNDKLLTEIALCP